MNLNNIEETNDIRYPIGYYTMYYAFSWSARPKRCSYLLKSFSDKKEIIKKSSFYFIFAWKRVNYLLQIKGFAQIKRSKVFHRNVIDALKFDEC